MIGLFRRAASWKPTSPALKTLVSHGAATGDSDCVLPPRRGILKLCEMARVRASEPVGEKKSIQQQLSQSKTEHRIVSSQNPLSGQLHSRRGPSFRDNRLATHDFNGRRLSAVTAVCQLAALVAGSFAREGRRKVASGKAPSEPAIVAALSACSCGRIVEIDRSRSGGHDWSRVCAGCSPGCSG